MNTFCDQCGQGLGAGARFCGQCGAPNRTTAQGEARGKVVVVDTASVSTSLAEVVVVQRGGFNWLTLVSTIAAIFAFLLALLLGFTFRPITMVLAIVAVATGVIALRQLAGSQQRGAGLAITGVILGGFELGWLVLFLVGAAVGLIAGVITAFLLKPRRPPARMPPAAGAVIVPETNGLAVASMVLGIVGFSFLALIFGYVARSQIRSSRGSQRGDGFAVAGIVLGWVGLAVACAATVALVLIINAGEGDPSGASFFRG